MALHLENLDYPRIRELMLAEITFDEQRNELYTSKRFTPVGEGHYPNLLKEAVLAGGDADLAVKLRRFGCFAEMEPRRKRNGEMGTAKVPANAPETFAEGEINRFYLRALCLVAIEEGIAGLEVYRARHSEVPRPESEALIGTIVEPTRLLDDLRKNIGLDTCLGLPPGPNSGLSARLPIKK